jgi:hypothetical protein
LGRVQVGLDQGGSGGLFGSLPFCTQLALDLVPGGL